MRKKLCTFAFWVILGPVGAPHFARKFDCHFYYFLFFQFQSDIFGSLNDQGLLSRASEALVAMDMKHPVSSAHQVFPQIKSDMMYSHPAISSSTAAGTSISRSSNQVRYQTNEDPLVFDTLPTLKSQDCNGCTASSVRRVLAISHTLLPTGVGNGQRDKTIPVGFSSYNSCNPLLVTTVANTHCCKMPFFSSKNRENLK